MAKIIHFPVNKLATPASFMEEAQRVIDEQGAETILVAAKCADGSWITGYLDADWGTRNEALGHIQADIIEGMIKANMAKYLNDVDG